MSRKWRNLPSSLAIAAIVAIVAYEVIELPYATWRGQLAAKRDIEQHYLRLREGGKPRPWFWDYQKAVYEHYGIEIVSTGCVVSGYSNAFDREYNRVMNEEIERTKGKIATSEMRNKVEQSWRKKDEGG